MRPQVAITVINLYYMVSAANYFEDNVSTMVHELTHALGFSDDLFPYWINSNGNLRGSSAVVKMKINWRVRNAVGTPKVQQVARDHFKCPTLEGLPLEDNGDAASAGSHWERVTLGNEYMTSSAMYQSVYSIFTQAALQDSNWYSADFTLQQEFIYGKNKGCDFVYKNCKAKERFEEFCYLDDVSLSSGYEGGCSYGHGFKSYCDTEDEFAAGNDNCAYYFSFSPPTATQNYDAMNCQNPAAYKDPNVLFEYVGADSRCFRSQWKSYTETNLQGNCFKYECLTDGTVNIFINGVTHNCNYPGQIFDHNDENSLYSVRVQCPQDYELICDDHNNICPLYCSSNGICIDGTCECKTGYTGNMCELSAATTFLTISTGSGTVSNCETEEPGTYADFTKLVCVKCNDTLTDCTSCRLLNGALSCKTCGNGKYLIFESRTCAATCLVNAYPDSTQNVCVACWSVMPSCLTCTSNNACTSCVPYTVLSADKTHCTDKCQLGLTQSQAYMTVLAGTTVPICKLCDYLTFIGCLFCSYSTKYACTSCNSGFYLVSGTSCEQCLATIDTTNSQCTQCSSKTVCTACATNYKLANPTSCAYNGCDRTCLTCYTKQNPTKCTTCPVGYHLGGNRGQSRCCDNSCVTCIGSTNSSCSSCQSNQVLKDGICSNCDATCKTCVVAKDLNKCKSCYAGYMLKAGASLRSFYCQMK